MDSSRVKTILLAVGVLAAAVVVAVMFFTTFNGEKPEPEKTGGPKPTAVATLPGGSGDPGDPSSTTDPADPEATPGATPAPTDAPEATGPDGVDTDPDHANENPDAGGEWVDMSGVKTTATRAVQEYSRWVEGETAAARAARLAPYFGAGSSYLSSKPEIANPWGYNSAEQTGIDWTREPLSAVNVIGATEYTVMTVAPYVAHYVVNDQPMDVSSTGTWDVRISVATGKVTALTEPDNLG